MRRKCSCFFAQIFGAVSAKMSAVVSAATAFVCVALLAAPAVASKSLPLVTGNNQQEYKILPDSNSTAMVGFEELLEQEKKAGGVFTDCANCPEMVVIPSGKFKMGNIQGGGDDNEKPVHDVQITFRFALGKTEVTRDQFRAFVESTDYQMQGKCWTYESGEWKTREGRSWLNPGYSQTASDPVVCVSWKDARAYVRWLSEETGEDYRLPTESEWEYAARAETQTLYSWGSSQNEQCRYGNGADKALKLRYSDLNWTMASCEDGYAHTAPVGSFAANLWGLHDMHGNVWEWVADCWTEHYRDAPSDGSARLEGDCSRRVRRGGSWFNTPMVLRSANRYGYSADVRIIFFGFRVARTLPQ